MYFFHFRLVPAFYFCILCYITCLSVVLAWAHYDMGTLFCVYPHSAIHGFDVRKHWSHDIESSIWLYAVGFLLSLYSCLCMIYMVHMSVETLMLCFLYVMLAPCYGMDMIWATVYILEKCIAVTAYRYVTYHTVTKLLKSMPK